MMKYTEKVAEALRSKGYEVKEFTSTDYVFKYKGVHFLYTSNEEDEHYLRMAAMSIYGLNRENEAAVKEAIAETNNMLQYGKLKVMLGGSIWAVYEHYLVSEENIDLLVEHIMNVLGAAIAVFFKILNGEEIGASEEDSID